jgi:hypothetical protein
MIDKYLLVLIVVLPLIVGCKKSVAEPPEETTPKFVLTADRTSGTAPLMVNFTGALFGKTDTIIMCVPDALIFPGAGQTRIPYTLPDTFQSPKVAYYESYTYGTGTYRAMMRLQTKYRTYLSDTITIRVN